MTIDTAYGAVSSLNTIKDVRLSLNQASMEKLPAFGFASFNAYSGLRLNLTARIDRVSRGEAVDTECIIHETDITTDKVDRLIELNPRNKEGPETLRLARIIWNGYKYAVDHEQEKRLTEAGRHPRAIKASMRF